MDPVCENRSCSTLTDVCVTSHGPFCPYFGHVHKLSSAQCVPSQQDHETPAGFDRLLASVTPHFLELPSSVAASLLLACARQGCAPSADDIKAYAARLCNATAYSDLELSVNDALQVCDTYTTTGRVGKHNNVPAA